MNSLFGGCDRLVLISKRYILSQLEFEAGKLYDVTQVRLDVLNGLIQSLKYTTMIFKASNTNPYQAIV